MARRISCCIMSIIRSVWVIYCTDRQFSGQAPGRYVIIKHIMSKNTVPTSDQQTTPATSPQSSGEPLPIVSFVLGVASLLGPGIFFGVPAIITAAIALKKQQGNRGLSITGLVTGIVSSVGSLLFLGFIILLIVIGLTAPSVPQEVPAGQSDQQLFDSAQL